MKHVKKINLDKYPIATMSALLGFGAFSGLVDFSKFNLNTLGINITKGIFEFISWYIFLKILFWLFSGKNTKNNKAITKKSNK